MKLNHELNVNQNQNIIMTPQLKLAIAILQFPSLELEKYIEEQLLENPVLELEEEENASEEKNYLDSWEGDSEETDFYYPKEIEDDNKEPVYEKHINRAPTLQDHLKFQLLLLKEGSLKNTCEYFIDNIDENGYLCVDIKEAVEDLGVKKSTAEKALEIIQNLEPTGVGARNLNECLFLQIKDKNIVDENVKYLILNFLEDFAKCSLKTLSKKTKVSEQKIKEAIHVLKELDPKPGSSFSSNDNVKYITPDAVVEKVDNELVVYVNDTFSSRLFINPLYYKILSQGDFCDPQTKKFIEDKISAARWLIKSIEQRRITLYRVVECIVQFQKEFFFKGAEYLKPLTLKQIAKNIDVHESTVSRIVSGKYIQANQGLFQLKFFFSSGIKNSSDTTSSRSIKELLKEYIKKEPNCNPYTDQHLTNVLQNQGLQISRRTVAKYRKELGIESAAKRKSICKT